LPVYANSCEAKHLRCVGLRLRNPVGARKFCMPAGGIFLQAHASRTARTRGSQSVKLVDVRLLLRFLLPALISVPLGFILLALAAQNEPSIPALVVMLFSPGLKLAELMTPQSHQSLAATFGWFLRIAIAVNAAYYFALFVLLASLFGRNRQSTVESRQ
jgi:hypothetical protein